MLNFKIGVLIPTLNAGKLWLDVLQSVTIQSIKPYKKIIIDSGSNDGTVSDAKKFGFTALQIKKKNFNHGFTRQLLANEAKDCDILIYMTQDCILATPDTLKNLVSAFQNSKVALAYGRQLPHKDAATLASHARLFNYPGISQIKSIKDKEKLGIKTTFCSNSFAAYRNDALSAIGGFPNHIILGEDICTCGKMLQNSWEIAYVAEAEVYHSHNYTVGTEFNRYFDIGVLHATNHWLLDEFGKPNGEGIKYLKSEFRYVIKHNFLVLPKMMITILAKFLGYRLGTQYNKLSLYWRKRFSLYKNYWEADSSN